MAWGWAAAAAAVVLLAWLGLRRLDRLPGADWGSRTLNRIDRLNRLFCHRYHGLHGERIALPAEGPALVVANHVSGLDPLLLIAASDRPLRFVIAKEQYHRFGLHWLFRAIGCIPVDRGGRADRAFRAAVRALEEGEVVALFPHGTIHLDHEKPRPLKPGVVRMARYAGCPVFPVRIEGVRGQGLVVAAVLLPSRAHLSTCESVDCADEAQEPACLESIARCIGARVRLSKASDAAS